MKKYRRSFQDDQESEANLFCEKRLKYLPYLSKQKQEEYLIPTINRMIILILVTKRF